MILRCRGRGCRLEVDVALRQAAYLLSPYDLTGKDNTFNGTVTITGSYYGKKASTLGVAKLGNINEPSSSGKNDKITFAEGSTPGSTGGGKLVYLGDGTLERSNKPLCFADTG